MGGKSGSSTLGFWYKLKLLFGLCQGPVDALLRFDVDGANAWSGEASSNQTIYINAEELFGGEDEQGGILGYADVMLGGQDQEVNSWLTSNLGSEHSAYRGLAAFAFKGGKWSAFTPYPKTPSFVPRRIFEGWRDDEVWYPETASIVMFERSIVEQIGPTSDGWSYLNVASGSVADYSGADYDSSGWSTGASPFASSDAHPYAEEGGFPLERGTTWPVNTNMWVRKWFTIPSPLSLSMTIFVDNFATVWVNGHLVLPRVGTGPGGNAAAFMHAFEVPAEYLLSGANLIALLAEDVGDYTYAAFKVTFQSGTQLIGMNAAHIIYDSITHPSMGDEPVETVNDASFRAAADVFYDEGMGLCPIYDPDSETIEQFQQRICDAAGAVLVQSLEGEWKLHVPRGDYVLEELPVLTDDDILDWSEEPTTLDDACNQLFVKYYDPLEDASGTTPPLQALGAIQAFGSIISEKEDRSGEVPTADLALRIGARNLRAKATPLRKFDLKATPIVRDWEPGTYFRLQAPKRGIADMVCLMGEKKGGTLKSGAIAFSCSEDVYSQPDTVYVGTTPGVTSPDPTPTVSADQQALEVPYVLLVGQLSAADLAALADDAGYLMAVSARPTMGQYFRLMAQAGGAEYTYRGRGDWAPSAALVEEAGYLTTDFTLADASDLDQVEVGELVLLEDELCRVDAIDADGLTITLARGCGDTVPQLHAVGARFYALVNYAADITTEFVGGESVYAKLLTRGVSALTDLSSAAELQVAMNDRQARPYPPAGLLINGGSYPSGTIYESIELVWAHRDRLAQADQIVDATVASIGPEAGVTYTVRVYDTADEALLDEQTGITGTTATSTPALDADVRVEVWAVRDGLESWQAPMHSFTWRVSALANYVDENDDTYADENGDTYEG